MKSKCKLLQAGMLCASALGMGTSLSFAASFSDTNWISMGGLPGADGTVRAVVADGSGNVYIGGDFTVVGEVIAYHVAKWDGSSWSALGSGVVGSVSALAVSGTNLYVGGTFTNAGGNAATNIAKWDGSSWSALGSGLGGSSVYYSPVNALAVFGTDVYAAGSFTTAGGIAATNIAKWDGSSWSALGSGIGGSVSALAVSGSDLYAASGGDVAKWDGSSWSALGSGMNYGAYPGNVSALAVSGSDLYAGGSFTTAGGTAATNVAKWDGSSWSALWSGVTYALSSGSVNALAVSGGAVYAMSDPMGGMYPPGYVLRWDGSNWSFLGIMNGNFSGGTFRPVYAMAVSGSDVYVGGYFTQVRGLNDVSGTPASDIAKWNGSSWSALGSGMVSVFPYDYVTLNALAVSGSGAYAGGYFTTAGGDPANCVARWNGSNWSALGSGIDTSFGSSSVNVLAVSGNDLYVGGSFTAAGGTNANSIAKWDGSSWSALGSGIGGSVSALAVSGSDLYAASGGYLAKWNGSWTNLGSGLNGSVSALAASGSDLYAGGQFTMAGGIAATNIAKWDGSSWSALGSGVVGSVRALAVSGTDLYVGGTFTNAGGIAATNIAKWDGSSWSAPGSGISGPPDYPYYGGSVSALAVSGADVYAGGSFTTAGGGAANGIAKWDGNSWSALGSGIRADLRYPPSVSALAVSGSELYAGGNFTTAGGKVSAYVARAIVNPPVLVIEPDDFGGYFLRFNGVPGSAYRLQRAEVLTGTWATSSPQTAPASGQLEFWDIFPPPGQGFYRSVGP